MSENIRDIISWQSEIGEPLSCYVRPIKPILDVSKLQLDLLVGDERKRLKTHTCGSFSLLLSYKKFEGAVASLDSKNTDLTVYQLQGSRSKKSYRVSSAVDWIWLFADKIDMIAAHPLTLFQRIVMPAPYSIPGLIDELIDRQTADSQICADAKYNKFIGLIGLSLSQLENAYIKDIRK